MGVGTSAGGDSDDSLMYRNNKIGYHDCFC